MFPVRPHFARFPPLEAGDAPQLCCLGDGVGLECMSPGLSPDAFPRVLLTHNLPLPRSSLLRRTHFLRSLLLFPAPLGKDAGQGQVPCRGKQAPSPQSTLHALLGPFLSSCSCLRPVSRGHCRGLQSHRVGPG